MSLTQFRLLHDADGALLQKPHGDAPVVQPLDRLHGVPAGLVHLDFMGQDTQGRAVAAQGVEKLLDLVVVVVQGPGLHPAGLDLALHPVAVFIGELAQGEDGEDAPSMGVPSLAMWA